MGCGKEGVLYLECAGGIAGDMLAGALLDLGDESDERAVREALASLPVEGFEVEISRASRAGIACCDFDVVLDGEHENRDHDMAYLHGAESGRSASGDAPADACADGPDGHRGARGHGRHGHDHRRGHGDHSHGHGDHGHRGLADIERLLTGARGLTDGARRLALEAFSILAEAEAAAHGIAVDEVHFHEVGAVDSIADIVAVSVLVDRIAPARVVAGPLPAGGGTVRCQHGVIPVPAPATVNVCAACGLELRPGPVEGELTTPTGAALLGALRPSAGLPARYRIRSVGYGSGKRSYGVPSLLRAMLVEPASSASGGLSGETEAPRSVVKLECDIDDDSPEVLAYAAELLRAAGGREVHWVPIFGKKGRACFELQAVCDESDAPALEDIIFRETSTLGVRRCSMERSVLPRELLRVVTEFGPVTVKRAVLPGGGARLSPEYGDCARAAAESGEPLRAVMDAALRAARGGC